MTTMKKMVSLLLAAMMLLCMANVAMAEETAKNDSITITSAKEGETYSIYKLFDLTVDSETAPKAYTYTVNSAWAAFFEGAGKDYITITNGAVTAISDAEDMAAAAAAYAEENGIPTAQADVTVGEGVTTAVFDGLANGYYLITSTLGTIAMTETTPDASDVTIGEKNPEDTISKTVQEDSTGEFGASNDAQIGDTVNFKSVATLVPGTRNVVIHDTMTDGLTFAAGSVQIEGLTAGTDYTVNEEPTDECTFEITFTDSYVEALEDSVALTITYSAVLNENAVANGPVIVDQTNTTEITYGDAQSVSSQTTTTTHKLTVNKYAEGIDNLADAEFQIKVGNEVVKLKKIDDTNYVVDPAGTVESFVTVASGDIVIWGLDSDEYTLVETKAPAGYNPLSQPVEVTVNADNSTVVDVLNNTGNQLPSTGGIGTTIFYVVGGLLAVMAVILLVTKRRMGEN